MVWIRANHWHFFDSAITELNSKPLCWLGLIEGWLIYSTWHGVFRALYKINTCGLLSRTLYKVKEERKVTFFKRMWQIVLSKYGHNNIFYVLFYSVVSPNPVKTLTLSLNSLEPGWDPWLLQPTEYSLLDVPALGIVLNWPDSFRFLPLGSQLPFKK